VNRPRIAALVLTAALVTGACGSDPDRQLAGLDLIDPVSDPDRQLVGYRREPAPVVGGLSLPDLTNPGADLSLQAGPEHLLVIYFGYTNCPDFCPTTLSDLRLATRRMDEDLAARVDVAMVTIDPERDLAVLPDYVTSFFADGHALGTDDDNLLAQAAGPFGVAYNIEQTPDGVTEVSHTTALYAVDDSGQLALTWPFGVAIDDLAADLTQLLESSSE